MKDDDESQDDLNEIKQRLELSVGDLGQAVKGSRSRTSNSVSETGSDRRSLNGSLHR